MTINNKLILKNKILYLRSCIRQGFTVLPLYQNHLEINTTQIKAGYKINTQNMWHNNSNNERTF